MIGTKGGSSPYVAPVKRSVRCVTCGWTGQRCGHPTTYTPCIKCGSPVRPSHVKADALRLRAQRELEGGPL